MIDTCFLALVGGGSRTSKAVSKGGPLLWRREGEEDWEDLAVVVEEVAEAAWKFGTSDLRTEERLLVLVFEGVICAPEEGAAAEEAEAWPLLVGSAAVRGALPSAPALRCKNGKDLWPCGVWLLMSASRVAMASASRSTRTRCRWSAVDCRRISLAAVGRVSADEVAKDVGPAAAEDARGVDTAEDDEEAARALAVPAAATAAELIVGLRNDADTDEERRALPRGVVTALLVPELSAPVEDGMTMRDVLVLLRDDGPDPGVLCSALE